jgi:cobalamin biosynthesis Mg chelatase CobN
MARAESYGDIARLEQLLDEHANIAALDRASCRRSASRSGR